MKDKSPFAHERLLELLGDRAVVGLDASEEADLENLLREYPGEDALGFDMAAASLDLALMRGNVAAMPTDLAQRIEHAADATRTVPSKAIPMRASGRDKRDRSATRATRFDLVRVGGWIAAAACLAIAVASWIGRAPGSAPTVASVDKPAIEARAELLARPGTRRIEWTGSKDPAATGVSGDVVFSVAEQRGYMRFRGLAANDRANLQYQLWIFDRSQDERFPIDGGVFDVDPATGDVIVPIRAKLRVTDPTLFAVTVEKPGGVVVSKRDRIVVTAASS